MALDPRILFGLTDTPVANPFVQALEAAQAVHDIMNLPIPDKLLRQKVDINQSNLDTAEVNRQQTQAQTAAIPVNAEAKVLQQKVAAKNADTASVNAETGNINAQIAKNKQANANATIDQAKRLDAHKTASKAIRPFIESGDFIGAASALQQVQGLTSTDLQDMNNELSTGSMDSILQQLDVIDSLKASDTTSNKQFGITAAPPILMKDDKGYFFNSVTTTGKGPNGESGVNIVAADGSNRKPIGSLHPVSKAGSTVGETAAATRAGKVDVARQKEKTKTGEKLKQDQNYADVQEKTAAAIAKNKAVGKGMGEAQVTIIENGLNASKGVAVVNRAIELLDSVKTSGINSALLSAKRFLGVDAADESELSYRLGRNILSQLRPIFGAQFTEREGAKLEGIEASFTKSPEGNRRILKSLLEDLIFQAKQAQTAARESNQGTMVAAIQRELDRKLDPDISFSQTAIIPSSVTWDAIGSTLQNNPGMTEDDVINTIAQRLVVSPNSVREHLGQR